jgi:hypothetical protein
MKTVLENYHGLAKAKMLSRTLLINNLAGLVAACWWVALKICQIYLIFEHHVDSID